jgi:hypothetical protein
MKKSVRKRVWTSLAVVASLALVGVVVAGVASAKGHEPEVVCKKIGKKKVSCPKKELHGKRGAPGPAGTQGATGPAGPGGPAGAPGANGVSIPLIFRGQPPTPNTAILNLGGLLINASCSTGSVTTLTGIPQIPGSVIRASDVITNETERSNDTFLNEHLSLNPFEGEDNYLLTYLAGNGSTIVTANYGVANGGLGLVNVSCAVFGTVQVAAG